MAKFAHGLAVPGDNPMTIFLSYAPSERELADDLADRLAAEGFQVWYADRELFPGDNWPLEIGKALQRSDAMIVLLSPAYVASSSLQREYGYALGASNFRQRVIPVVVRPTEDVPWMLARIGTIEAGRNWERACQEIVERLREETRPVG